MATQKGIIKLEGAIGDISFYKSKGKYFARSKGGVDGDRIKNDPAFERTRENGSEFGRAGKAGKLLRNALREVIQNSKDSRMSSRLTREMLKAIQADDENARGARTITAGDVTLLKGFEFNDEAKLGNTVFMPYNVVTDRVAGTLKVTVPAFIPANTIGSPAGATHAIINLGGTEVDFDAENFTANIQHSAHVALKGEEQAQIELTANVSENSDKPLFMAFGLEFYQEVNGEKYPLKNGAYNALALIEVNVV